MSAVNAKMLYLCGNKTRRINENYRCRYTSTIIKQREILDYNSSNNKNNNITDDNNHSLNMRFTHIQKKKKKKGWVGGESAPNQ